MGVMAVAPEFISLFSCPIFHPGTDNPVITNGYFVLVKAARKEAIIFLFL
jgi:hypothetical protein